MHRMFLLQLEGGLLASYIFRMLWAGAMLVAAVGVASDSGVSRRACYHHQTAADSIYDLVETDLLGQRNISFSDYRGKSGCPSTRDTFMEAKYLLYSPQRNSDIRWNWEKFLITKSGKPYMRYDPETKPEQMRNDILFLLQQEE
ncbi:hypothetical protein Pcinc_037159 [Petrolisthes cinctipes]|uniref:glutathione peroxidase n=1 Tax=Petrolisthes cinctipes TaxID=88211 RepID=A0AAE1BWI8_PETCI|nr:hypothetical protein Pcinc_037159 [Petrolisthes cinctipes]